MDVINYLRKHIENTSKLKGLGTGDVRSISAKVFKLIEDKNIDNVLGLCEQLLKTGEWAFWIIAYDWAYRVRSQYTPGTYEIFKRWLENYVTGWDDCDDFCTHAFGELISMYNELFPQLLELTSHESFPVRRGAAVVLIKPIRSDRIGNINPFLISDALMNDRHYLVLKGYGWMLKVLSQYKPEEVYDYLAKNHQRMPRLAFNYALEKMDSELRKKLRTL
ncbi:MAG: DNA alkylation repair protein [Clostridia bacterium]|nr:DNA alkylation repair protein [Clostridia bacterium]